MNKNKFYIFVADWCPYCRAAKPGIFELVDKYYNNNNIVLIEDTSEEYQESATRLNVQAFPAFVIEDEEGKEVTRFEGERTFEHLLGFYISNTETPVLDGDNPIY
jgi:thiol-disulfide isomerase/thioredoxin